MNQEEACDALDELKQDVIDMKEVPKSGVFAMKFMQKSFEKQKENTL